MSGATGDSELGLIHRHDPPAQAGGRGDGWTLLLLHGTGGDENQFPSLGRELLPGAALLSPRGHVLEGGAPRFFPRSGMNQFDPEAVAAGVDVLARFIEAATTEYGLAPERLVALGYSNGANAALAAMQRHPGLMRGAVLLRPMLVLDPQPTGTPLDGTSLLALSGGRDPYLDASGYERLVKVTGEQGADVTGHLDPAAGHELTRGDLTAAAHWLKQLTA